MNRFRTLLFVAASGVLLLPTAGLALAQHGRPAAAHIQVKVAKNAKLGKILVNAKGFTLYHLLRENTGTVVCAGGCLGFWPPLTLPKGASKPTGGKAVTGKLGTVSRGSAGKQITYDGWPLYTFKNDAHAGQTNGNGFKAFNSTWEVVHPAPMVPYTINITTSPPTWGTVTLKYTYLHKKFHASCGKASCTINVHAGVKVHLSEKPVSRTTWPFSGWQAKPVDGGSNKKSSKPSFALKSNDGYDITATYVLSSRYP